jgi:hypothetical protein
MNGYDWPEVAESWDSDWPETYDWGGDSAEFLPSPSLALAKGLISRARSGRRVPSVVSRPGGRPPAATGPVPPVLRDELQKVYETMKRLEQKQDEQTKQVALLSARSSGLQTGDVFRQALTTAALNATPAIASKDFGTAVAQLVPLAQSWRGLGPSFSAKPVSTIGFPAVTALLLFLLRKPEPPIIAADSSVHPAKVTIRHPGLGVTLRYTTTGNDPTKSDPEYTGTFATAKKGEIVKVRAFTPLVGVGSDVVQQVYS